MVGLGTERDGQLCRDAGILPLLNHPDWRMRQVYVGCDIYVTASRWEGFNLPVLEAQYFGKPVLAYDLAAHPEVVKPGETGFLVKDQESFENNLRELVADPGLRERMGAKGREWAGRFNWMDCARNFERLLEDVTAGMWK